jgi:hypothetical protein
MHDQVTPNTLASPDFTSEDKHRLFVVPIAVSLADYYLAKEGERAE